MASNTDKMFLCLFKQEDIHIYIYISFIIHFRHKSGLDESTDFLVFQSYSDEKTFALVGAVCDISGR